MRTRRWAVLITGLLALALPAWSASPVRVMVKPPEPALGGKELRERTVCANQVLALFLYDWLEAAPDARLVDEAQARSVFGSLLSRAWVRRPENLLADIRPLVPVEAVVTWTWKPGVLLLQVYRPEAVRSLEIAWPSVASTPAALKTVAEAVCAELGIPSDSSPLSRGLAAEPGLIEAYFLSRRMRAEWVDNSGVMQLEALQPYLKRLPKDVWIAAAIMRAGVSLSTDKRAVPNPAASIMMVQQALPAVLGTPFEELALDFVRQNKIKPETIEKDLIGMIAKLGRDEVEAALDAAAPDAPEAGPADGVMDSLGGAKSPVQQAGAIRCLGVMQSGAARPILESVARSKDPALRQAAAWAAGCYPSPFGDDWLKKLSADPDPGTRLQAAWSLKKHGTVLPDLAGLAVQVLTGPGHLDCPEAWMALAEYGTTANQDLLVNGRGSEHPRVRAQAVKGLQRLGQPASLDDTDAGVTVASIESLLPAQLPKVKDALVPLANHPDSRLSEGARLRLASLAPADPGERIRFDLAVEHPYVRRTILAKLAEEKTPAALDLLAEAAVNPDPHTRVCALALLAGTEPARAKAEALKGLGDAHRWVRLQASAVLAETAGPGEAAAVKQALAGEADEAARLYLEDALAKAEGRPLPAPRPAAHAVGKDATQTFLCGHGNDCTNSPIQGYYDLAYNPDEPARQAHAAGKVFLARANMTAKNPAQVLLHGGWRDGFWLGLDEDFGDLAALDGIVLGEESMYFRPWNEWSGGWRLFCREAGIDPSRVAGDREKLTPLERQAFLNWEQRVAVEGFNVMADWIRLDYGKRKPGFQVVTFMPDQNGPCDYDRQWRFDVGAGYFYETGNRHRYTQIRRFRTLWPDRPVLWLCDGNPTSGADAPLNYRYKPLTNSVPNPAAPPYADALCAWMAGAQPGYFYSKLAIGKDMKAGPSASGVWVTLEDLTEPVLKKALDTVYRGVDEQYRTESEMKQAHAAQADRGLEADAREVDVSALMGADPAQDAFAARAKAEREAMRRGLLLERETVFACARFLSNLPRLSPTNTVLLVGDIRAQAGALRLPVRYDFLDGINKVAGGDLSSYRLIAVTAGDSVVLRDAAIEGVTRWLRETPGLLVVRGWLPAENTAEAPTAADLDGTLRNDWPWEKDVAPEGKGCRVIGPNAADRGDGLVFWQDKAFKGGVLFDRSELAPDVLRDRINALCAERKIGVVLSGPIGMETADWPGGSAAVSCKKGPVAPYTLRGKDPLTGTVDPVLGIYRMGACVTAPEGQAHD